MLRNLRAYKRSRQEQRSLKTIKIYPDRVKYFLEI